MGKGLPVNMLAGDPSLTGHLTDHNNPWITSSLKIWSEIIKGHQLKGGTETFMPSEYDSRLSENQTFCLQDISRRPHSGEILDMFQVISKLYLALQSLKRDHILNIKARREAEGNFTITE